MKKKYKVIVLIIIVILIILGISIKIGTDFTKETKIKKEVQQIIELFNKEDYDSEKIHKILNRQLVNKGNYSEVEKSIKAYYKDLQEDLSNINFLLSEDNYTNYLSNTNLKEDQPSFTKSKNNLNNTKSQIEEIYTELNTQLNNQTNKVIYIADKDISSYYKDLYLSLIEDYITEEFKKKINNKKNNTISKIDIYNEAFDYLIANKGNWSIRNDSIVFDEQLYHDEYTTIKDKLKEVK